MNVFYQLVYEYQKGLRDLCLLTCSDKYEKKIKQSLNNQNIKYLIYPLKKDKINLFFGMPECLEILSNFSSTELNNLTIQEDFILGIMLGYGRAQQYQRYLSRRSLNAIGA